MGAGAATALAAAGVSRALIASYTPPPEGLDQETVRALFGLESMPPLPLFLATAVGFACVVVGAGLMAAGRWPGAWWLRALAATGRMALTWYVLHILVGVGGLIALGADGTAELWTGVVAASAFFAGIVAVSWVWMARIGIGPLEWLMRRATAS
jgi:uncharacterized membrane protein YeiB